jgi:hypothetical protein
VLRAAASTTWSHDQCMAPVRESLRSSPLTRAVARKSMSAGSSSGDTSSGPSEVAKSLPLAGPRPTDISLPCRSRADQSFMRVYPSIPPSAPITAASSSS